MFFAQVVCTTIAGTVQLGVQAWMFENIEGMCTEHQANGFICPGTQVFGTASIIWGVIGPALQFSHGKPPRLVFDRVSPRPSGQIYYGLVFFFLAGACMLNAR